MPRGPWGMSRDCWTSPWSTYQTWSAAIADRSATSVSSKSPRLLEADPAPLIAAADVEKGVIEYYISKAKPLEARVVGDLVSGLARGGVTEDQLERIRTILKDSE